MKLVFDIALTHVRARLRHTGVAVAGVATGVGFSVMMAALMQGSQDDFIRQLVNALPHISVTDERRSPPRQPSRGGFRGCPDPWSDAGDAPARHQEPARHHGRSGGPGCREASRLPSRCRRFCAMPRVTSVPPSSASIRGASRMSPSSSARCGSAPSRRSIAPPTPSFSVTGSPRRSAHGSAPTSRCRPRKAPMSTPRWSVSSMQACVPSTRARPMYWCARARFSPARPGS